jgi:hypothetical protein
MKFQNLVHKLVGIIQLSELFGYVPPAAPMAELPAPAEEKKEERPETGDEPEVKRSRGE